MARNLTITFGANSFSFVPVKVDRAKLYGTTELRVTNADGRVCHIAGINGDGITVIDSGCVKTGMITDDGCWMDRDELIPLLPNGTEAPVVSSSFDTGIALDSKATEEDLLSINISSVYQLSGDDASSLLEQIGSDIYAFPFNYCPGCESSQAFMIAACDTLFIITGSRAPLEFIGIEQSGVLDDACSGDGFDDELDFSMM